MRRDCRKIPCELPDCDCPIEFEFIDSDGKDDFTEGKTYDSPIDSVDYMDKDITYYALPKDSRLKRIFKAGYDTIKNNRGTLGRVKDVLSLFVPYGGKIDRLTDAIGNIIFNQKQETYMEETFFDKAKRYIRQPSTQSALALLAAVLGSSYIGLNIDVALLTESAVGILTGLSGAYASAIAIYDMIRDEDK